MHLLFLELDRHKPQLDFKILAENNNVIIPSTFYLQLLNKLAYMTLKQQAKLPRFEPYGTTRTTNISPKKLTEIEAYLLDEIEVRERIAKKMKRFNTITGIVDTGLITSTVITGGISIAAFANGVGLPVGIALSGTSLLLSLATVITQKSFKTFTVKQEKHDSIKLLAQTKLRSIVNIISQAIQDGEFSPTEFHKLLQEVEEYRKLKADIRNQAKAKIK